MYKYNLILIRVKNLKFNDENLFMSEKIIGHKKERWHPEKSKY